MRYGEFRERGSVLTSEECAQLQLALQNPEYVSRLLADARAADMVEVDNPVRRETRPRRGRE